MSADSIIILSCDSGVSVNCEKKFETSGVPIIDAREEAINQGWDCDDSTDGDTCKACKEQLEEQ